MTGTNFRSQVFQKEFTHGSNKATLVLVQPQTNCWLWMWHMGVL